MTPERALTPEGAELISMLDDPIGWRTFLPRVGKSSFKSEFAVFHAEFWDWYWHLTFLRKKGLPITDEILTFIAAWGRGNAKSTSIEWACLTEGMMGLDGYVLYVSLTQQSAESHVAAIRKRLESTSLGHYFPDLAEPKLGKHKNRFGWRQNFLQTQSGWAIRPIGLDTAVRGLKEEDLRPSLIVFDDIDTYKISPEVVATNLEIISRDILGAGTHTTIQLVAQNLIAEHCAVNQIIEGRTSVLAEHVASVYPAFEQIEVEKRIDRKSGEPAYEITKCVPIWEQFDSEAARINLNKMGLEAFMAEYQHDFTLDKTDRVVPEYDENLHVITWSQFLRKFPDAPREGHVPKHWQVGVGLDVGYTTGHVTGWSWIALSAEDSALPNTHFRFRVKSFVAKSINEQATDVVQTINYIDPSSNEEWHEPDQYAVMKMSHEALNERMILVREYGLLFSVAKFGSEDGIAQWRSALRVDTTMPHPFHEDEQDPVTGRWKLGRPNYFDVVPDNQVKYERDKSDMALAIYQVVNWKRVKTKLTATGLNAAKPMKYEDDINDSTRMVFAESTLHATPLTSTQKKLAALIAKVGLEKAQLTVGAADYMGQLMMRAMELREIEKSEDQTQRHSNLLANLLGPPRR